MRRTLPIIKLHSRAPRAQTLLQPNRCQRSLILSITQMGSLKNAIVAIAVPLPSIIFYLCFINSGPFPLPSNLHQWCIDHPLLLSNLLFFLNVNLLFWLTGLLLSNHWMIDLYWTVIPVMLAHYYEAHPKAELNGLRSKVSILLTWVWSLRLTHSYFRREKWEWGAREDWRFSDMRRQYGKQWWWISFFAVYLSQQVNFMIWVLIGIGI